MATYNSGLNSGYGSSYNYNVNDLNDILREISAIPASDQIINKKKVYDEIYNMYEASQKIATEDHMRNEQAAKQKELFSAELLRFVNSFNDKKILSLKTRHLVVCHYEYSDEELKEKDFNANYRVHLVSVKGKSEKILKIWDDQDICMGYDHMTEKEAVNLLHDAQKQMGKRIKAIEKKIKLAAQIVEQEKIVHGFNFDILEGEGSPDMEPWG